MIHLPIEIGDVILTGRFKNHKVKVKEIGVDDHGLPTVNGKGILKIRIEKLEKSKKESSMNLKKIIDEILLKEFDATGSDLEKEIQEYADISDEIDRLQAQMKQLESRFEQLDAKFVKMLETLETELGSSKETFIRAKNILITIKRKGYERTDYKYKMAFEWLNERVSPQMKKLVANYLESKKTITWVDSKLGVQREGKINENWLTDLVGKVRGFFIKVIANLRKTNQGANSALDKLEGMI